MTSSTLPAGASLTVSKPLVQVSPTVIAQGAPTISF